MQAAQIRQRSAGAFDHILVDPTDAARVRPERRRHPGRQPLRREIEILEDAAARPIEISAILEHDVDEGHPEIREAAHDLCPRHPQQRRRQWIGDLVLDDLRRLAGKLGVDDDLRVREIRDRIEGRVEKRPDPRTDRKHREQDNDERVPDRTVDQACDHLAPCWLPAAKPSRAERRLLSASIRKFAPTTTRSPSCTPSRICA